ncbi:MAG: prepilin-type N-terminal cleavage/methylation domain-containing protein, partial [Planctomycetota bacterium]|nr:prepilin-type N-terminal cleavage/methylation domain-containing protein [Planctomycetota bacterium]
MRRLGPCRRLKPRSRRGVTLVEVTVCLAIMSILLLGMAAFLARAHEVARLNERKSYAVQRAIQMVNELKSFVETSGEDAAILDAFDDGILTKPELTIQTGVTPDSPVSGNVTVRGAASPGTQWMYSRRISVLALVGQGGRDVRLVTVRVFQTSDEQTDDIVLAEVETVIRTAAETFPARQVYDIYVIAIENVPGWWVYMAYIKPFIENTL